MDIEMGNLPDQMGLAALGERCQHEMQNFRRGESSNDQYCLEIFYRAINKLDEQAWEMLVRIYRGMVGGWLRGHPSRDSALRYDHEENYIDDAFTRFWRATARNQELHFKSLGAALYYLKACLDGAVKDTIRTHLRSVLSLSEPTGDNFFEEPASEEDDEGRDLWEAVSSLLPSEQEKRLAYLIIYCGLKPRQVMQQCPGEFSDVYEIYRLYRNIDERLRRNADRLRWRLSDEG